mmetsp:Transcript_9231/g.20511  ORF Transcript_9231/g.20511 Transcript_9231/m.20511 type:complete len:256 (+) Transcript_9231:154-921(+)
MFGLSRSLTSAFGSAALTSPRRLAGTVQSLRTQSRPAEASTDGDLAPAEPLSQATASTAAACAPRAIHGAAPRGGLLSRGSTSTSPLPSPAASSSRGPTERLSMKGGLNIWLACSASVASSAWISCCAARRVLSFPLDGSQRISFSSKPALKSSLPPLRKRTAPTMFWWPPFRVRSGFKSAVARSSTSPASVGRATVRPSGETAKSLMSSHAVARTVGGPLMRTRSEPRRSNASSSELEATYTTPPGSCSSRKAQ